jgi:hypothetical protein
VQEYLTDNLILHVAAPQTTLRQTAAQQYRDRGPPPAVPGGPAAAMRAVQEYTARAAPFALPWIDYLVESSQRLRLQRSSQWPLTQHVKNVFS